MQILLEFYLNRVESRIQSEIVHFILCNYTLYKWKNICRVKLSIHKTYSELSQKNRFSLCNKSQYCAYIIYRVKTCFFKRHVIWGWLNTSFIFYFLFSFIMYELWMLCVLFYEYEYNNYLTWNGLLTIWIMIDNPKITYLLVYTYEC